MRLQLLPLFCSSFDLETFQVDEVIRFLNQGFGFCCSFGGGGGVGWVFFGLPSASHALCKWPNMLSEIIIVKKTPTSL